MPAVHPAGHRHRKQATLKTAEYTATVGAELDGLYRFARRLTAVPHAADDLVQDTVLRGLHHCLEFRGDSTLATWLHRIMWHLAVDQSRHSRHELLVDEVEDRWRDDHYSLDPQAVTERATDAESLREALVRLPFIYRSALVLHDSLGWPHQEIADRLEITVANSKQRVHRARMLLVTALHDAPARERATKGVGMRCWDAREQVSDYLDGALDAAARRGLEAHLAECPTCPSLYSALIGCRDAMGELRDADDVVPPHLAERIRTTM
ncbi:MAG: sigma-70 family RNA polymerase sigma factor [Actinomycetota bacterium]|nr:sigma-70 family RNA polymerase sigma factor [Actinomycetota bacterium]